MHNRFGDIALGKEVWIHNEAFLHQWLHVLRYRVGDQLVVFNDQEERLYKIVKIEGDTSVKLELITELDRKIPEKEVYLLWSVLKKDKNDWVIQKAVELGVHKLVPIIAERSEKTGLNIERAQKIIIEASEQCGRGDIPEIREPITLHEALEEYKDLPLFICEQHDSSDITSEELEKLGVLIGPEGGWTDQEKESFKTAELPHIAISDFTLRAETAAVVAVSKLLG
jgi:16S rRNA (uracil1498-N3)-methyltransferase